MLSYISVKKIHIGLEIWLYRWYIAPIWIKPVTVYFLYIHISYYNIFNKIISVLIVSLLDKFNKKSSSDYIYSCGNRLARCRYRFLFKFHNSSVFIALNDTESACIFWIIKVFDYNRNISFLLNMILNNLIVIQLVYAITRCNNNIRFMAVS